MSKFRWNKNQVVTTNPFIYCNVSSAAAPIFKQINFFCKSTKIYQYKNTAMKNTINNYGIIQSYYTLSNKNNGAELMFLFNIGLSRLINKLSLISNRNLFVPWTRMVKSSNEGSWLQNRRCSRIEISADGVTFLKVKGEMPICSPDLIFKCLSILP